MNGFVRACALAAALGCGMAAHASLLVDTGEPPNLDDGYVPADPVLGLAASFTVAKATTVTAIRGYMQVDGPVELTASIFAGTPHQQVEPLFQATVDQYRATGWLGFEHLQWDLAPGTYTVAFGSTGAHMHMYGGAPRPLGAEWWYAPWFDRWMPLDDMDLSIRISAVPEPDAALLALLGLAAVAAAVRRNR